MTSVHLSAATVLVAALLAGCRNQPREIRIGVIANLGDNLAAVSGQGTIDGARLAVSQANQRGGLSIGGRRYRVALVERDIGNSPDSNISATRGLLNRDSVVAIVGPQFSRDAIASGALAEAARVPLISPMSTNPLTTRDRRFVFRVAFVDSFQSAVLARVARERIKATTAAVLFDASQEYSRGLAEGFRAAFESRGGRIVAWEHFTGDRQDDFSDQLRRIVSSKPELLFLPNYALLDSIQVSQARRLGVTAALLGGDSWDSDLMGRLPEAEGAHIVHQWHPSAAGAEASGFVAAYRAAFGRPPKVTAAVTFDAFGLLFAALERAGNLDSESIRAALAATRDFRGVTGTINYHGNGNPDKTAVLIRMVGGHGVFEAYASP